MEGSFVRELDLESLSKTLKLHQKLEGDVSCVVWDSSIVLAKYLEKLCENRTDLLKNLNVVELGAGVGCVGLTAACLGANALLTDLPEALPLLKLNINCNEVSWRSHGGQAEAVSLSWGEDLEIKHCPDIILLADCIYYEKSIELLIKTLRELASNETEIILSQELRETEKQKGCWRYFQEKIKQHFEVRYVPLSEQNPEYQSPDIVILRLTKL